MNITPAKRLDKKLIFLVLFFSLIIYFINFVIAAEICNNGIDDNNDGLVDGLKLLDPNNQETFIVGNTFSSVYNFVKTKSNIGYCPLPGHGNALLLSNNAPWVTGIKCSNIPLNELDFTATKVCNLAGYNHPLSWSSDYNDGGINRCNFFTPYNDCIWYWDGTQFQYNDGLPKFEKRWITGLSCINKIPQCSDGIDNDKDGLIDKYDPGCSSPNDDDERPHDPNCPSDCATNNDCGQSYCGNYGDAYCKSGNVYHSRICHDKGCSDATHQCTDITRTEESLVSECGYGCENRQCKGECDSNNDCDDDNLSTFDKCENPGAQNSHCTHTKVNCVTHNDCGTTGFFGDEFCSNSDVFKNFKNSVCVNPGQLNSYCNVTTTPTFLIDCGSNFCEPSGNAYCKNNNLYRKFWCNYKGCKKNNISGKGECFSSFNFEEDLIKNCTYGCENNACLPECATNSDCSNGKICVNGDCVLPNCKQNSDCGTEGYVDSPFCQGGDVYQNYINFTCNHPGTKDASCSSSSCAKLKQDCTNSQICSNGACVNPVCTQNSDCGQNRFLGEPFCTNNDLYDRFITYTCNSPGTINASCSNSTEFKLKQNCLFNCVNASCVDQGECETDSDCKADFYGEKYCAGWDVYKNLHDYSCKGGKCSEKVIAELVTECDHGCSDGKCTSGGGGGYFEDDSYSGPLVYEPTVKYPTLAFNYTPVNESIVKITTTKIPSFNIRYYIWAIILLILIILIIILIVLFLIRG